jgi:hypothetical protein
MQTRSQTRYEKGALYTVNINFDEAIQAWRSNKKHIGNGYYKYICGHLTKNGLNCRRESIAGSEYCALHNKNAKKI